MIKIVKFCYDLSTLENSNRWIKKILKVRVTKKYRSRAVSTNLVQSSVSTKYIHKFAHLKKMFGSEPL